MRELPPALIAKLNIGAGVVTPSESANPAEITRLKATRKKNTPHTTRGTLPDFRPRPSRDRRAAPGGGAGSLPSWGKSAPQGREHADDDDNDGRPSGGCVRWQLDC